MKTPWWRRRDYVDRYEGRLTILQVIGFWLLAIGILYFLIGPILLGKDSPEGVAISFFIIMLGVALAFPDMLKGQTRDISTMRIVVFMFANVICLLMLKVGWSKGSLEEVGLDSSWVWVIAFLFGAKAAQAYAENKSRTAQAEPDTTERDVPEVELAELAVEQNETQLRSMYRNIDTVSDTLKNGSACVSIYFHGSAPGSLPKEVPVKKRDGNIVKVPTEIIAEIGTASAQIDQSVDDVTGTDHNAPGSICCLVRSDVDPGFRGLVTAGHVFTGGAFDDYSGPVDEKRAQAAFISGTRKGKLLYQRMKSDRDIAVVGLSDLTNIDNGYVEVEDHYNVAMSDLNDPTKVTVLSKGGKTREAFILDYGISTDLRYGKDSWLMRNVILIGSDRDRTQSRTVSTSGDSGSPVLVDGRMLVGMLIGGNDRFSFVLPMRDALEESKFKPI